MTTGIVVSQSGTVAHPPGMSSDEHAWLTMRDIRRASTNVVTSIVSGVEFLPEHEKRRDAALAALDLANRHDSELSAIERPATKREIAQELAILTAAFATSAKAEAQVFGRLLIEDVASTAPTLGALRAACRDVRRTSDFMPSIAEVLRALERTQTEATGLREVLDRLPARIEQLTTLIEREASRQASVRKAEMQTIRKRLLEGRADLEMWFSRELVAEVRQELDAEGWSPPIAPDF